MDSDEPADDGEIGRVVITDLFNYAFPIIRYENGDLAVRETLSDGTVYLKDVVGRKVDMLYTTDGKMVNWLRALIFLKDYNDIRQFQVVQHSYTDFEWILNTDNHGYEDLITREAKDVFGEDSVHRFKYVNEIPKLASGKTQMTVCKIGGV
jgi:phenylacetate-CoA ligase